MADDGNYETTVLSITGKNHFDLHLLANLSQKVTNPSAIWSIIIKLAHRPEVQWNRLHGMIEDWLSSMDETPAGDIYAVSIDGYLYHAIGEQWVGINLGCTDGLLGIWAASNSDLFTVGASGWLARITNMVPAVTRDKNQRRLNAVHGTDANNVYAVGSGGVVFHYDGTAWTEIDSPTNVVLYSVLCHGQDVYLAGEAGVLFRKVGDVWTRLRSPEDLKITGLAWYQDALFAAAGLRGLYRLETEELELVKELIFYRLKVVGDLLFCFGGDLVAQYNGSEWWGGKLEL